MFPDKGWATVTAALALLTLSGCGTSSTTSQGPSTCAGSTSCSGTPTSSANSPAPRDVSPDLGVLVRYLNAVEHGDCATAERFVNQPATGDFCIGQHLGPMHFDQWRNPLGMPTPSCCVGYTVELHVTQEVGDAKLPRWVTRTFGLRSYPSGYRLVGVGTVNGQ